MKKFMMIAVMAVAALTANAQKFVGGSFAFASSHVNGKDNSEKTFIVKPEVGFELSDKFDAILGIGYTHQNDAQSTSNTWSFEPTLRYNAVKVGNFGAFVDGGVYYAFTHVNGAENNKNSLGFNITPGIAYELSDKVSVEAKLGDGLYYDHSWTKDVKRTNEFGFTLFNQIMFSVYYNL